MPRLVAPCARHARVVGWQCSASCLQLAPACPASMSPKLLRISSTGRHNGAAGLLLTLLPRPASPLVRHPRPVATTSGHSPLALFALSTSVPAVRRPQPTSSRKPFPSPFGRLVAPEAEIRPSRRLYSDINSSPSGSRSVGSSVGSIHASMAGSDRPTVVAAREPPALPLAPLPQPSKFKIALCQLAVTPDKSQNIKHARSVIEQAADNGAQLILLPEMWNCPYSNDSFPSFAEEIEAPSFSDSPSAAMLAEVAASKSLTIVGGSIPERRQGKLYNTSLVFGPDGALLGRFSKLHLFDIDIPGKMTFKESLTLTPGQDLLVVDTEVGRLGLAICYDIRFPELAMLYAARGVHMLCIPGAFNMTTGPLHWELLQRSRAADNQIFVATCSPARDDSASYRAWGHSTLCGPFGEVLATTEHEEATVIAEIDLEEIPQRRQSLPFNTQRRGDVYTLLDKMRK